MKIKSILAPVIIFIITVFFVFPVNTFAHVVNIGPGESCPTNHYESFPGSNQCIHAEQGAAGLGAVGVITPPQGTIPETSGDPSTFVASLIRNGIWLMVIVAFIIAVIWMILAGLSFIFAGDDPKKVQAAWGKVYWGLIGLVIVIGSFAIIKLVETFFGITVISGGFQLPT